MLRELVAVFTALGEDVWHVLRRILRAFFALDRGPDDFCAALIALGLEAKLLPRGATEESAADAASLPESARGRSVGRSAGVIAITSAVIRWANIREIPQGEDDDIWVDFGVPDPRLAHRDLRGFELSPRSVRTAPLVGSLLGVRWRGDDRGSGVAHALETQDEVGAITTRLPSLTIRVHQPSSCWTISICVWRGLFSLHWRPGLEEWGSLEALGRVLQEISLEP